MVFLSSPFDHPRRRVNFVSFLTWLAMVGYFGVINISGCAKNPPKQISYGEDAALVAKSDLQGEFFLEELLARGDKLSILSQYVAKGYKNSALLLSSSEPINLANNQASVRFEIMTRYLTVHGKAAGQSDYEALYSFDISHYDLVPSHTAKGEATRYLVRDQLTHINAKDRAYIDISNLDTPIFFKPDNNTDISFFRVSQLQGSEWLANEPIPGISEFSKSKLIESGRLTPTDHVVMIFEETQIKYVKEATDKTQTILFYLPNPSYVDLLRATEIINGQEEPTPRVVAIKKGEWQSRKYIALSNNESLDDRGPNPNDLKNMYLGSDIADAYVFEGDFASIPVLRDVDQHEIKKQLLGGGYYTLNIGDRIDVLRSEDYLYFARSIKQTIKGGERRGQEETVQQNLVVFPIGHWDFVNALDSRTGEKTMMWTRDNRQRNWAERTYIEVNPKSAQFGVLDSRIKDSIAYVQKRALTGTFKSIAELPGAPDVKFDLRSAVAGALAKLGLGLGDGESLRMDIGKGNLRIYKVDSQGQEQLVLVYSISRHVDLRHIKTSDGKDTSVEISEDMQTHTSMNERDTIVIDYQNPKVFENKVQPRSLPKSMFDPQGEYIYMAMVTSIKSDNGVFFPGQSVTSEDSRVKFKFSADNLIVYKNDQPLNSGEPSEILKFPAQHFNIEQAKDYYLEPDYRQIENHDDLSWEERSFTRIDLESNLIPNYFNNLFGIPLLYQGNVLLSRRELLDDIHVDGDLIYYDTKETFTINARVENSVGEMGFEPSTVVIRHSFLKVNDREKNYKPQVYNWHYEALYGFFWTTRLELDEFHRPTDNKETMFLNRHNIENGRQIVYYLNDDWPVEKIPVAQKVIQEWNAAFKKIYPDRAGDVVVLSSDDRKNLADPRYNMLVWIKGAYDPSPAGYGPSLTDPKTGEIISAKAFYYPDVSLSVAKRVKNYYEIFKNGCLSDDQKDLSLPAIEGISSGCVRSAALTGSNLINPVTGTVGAPGSALDAAEDGNHLALEVKGLPQLIKALGGDKVTDHIEGLLQSGKLSQPVAGLGRMRSLSKALSANLNILSEFNVAHLNSDPSNEWLSGLDTSFLLGSDTEDMYSGDLDTAQFVKASLTNLIEVAHHEQMSSSRQSRLDTCMLSGEDNLNSVISYIMANKDKPLDDLIKEAVEQYEVHVFLHEMGHNMGLSHNFAGSFDKNNYPDEYFTMLKDPSAASKHILAFTSSSVMDYNVTLQGNLNSLGKYDLAAIRWGYKGQLESTSGRMIERQTIDHEIAKRISSSDGFEAADAKVRSVVYDSFRAKKHLFCIDWEVGTTTYCNRFDRGFTMTEIVQSMSESYDLGYYFNAFRRGRRNYGLRGSVLSSYVFPIQKIVMDYMFKANNPSSFPGGSAGIYYDTTKIVPRSYGDYQLATIMGNYFLGKVLNSVDGKDYVFNEQNKRFETSGTGQKLTVSLDFNKQLYSNFDYNVDKQVHRQLESLGVASDKMEVILGSMIHWDNLADNNLEEFYWRPSLQELLPSVKEGIENNLMRIDEYTLPAIEIDATHLVAIDPLNLPLTEYSKLKDVKVYSTNFRPTLPTVAAILYMFNMDNFWAGYKLSDVFDLRTKGVDDQDLAGVTKVEFKSSFGNKTFVVPALEGERSVTYEIALRAQPISKKLWDLRDKRGPDGKPTSAENNLDRQLKGLENNLLLLKQMADVIAPLTL